MTAVIRTAVVDAEEEEMAEMRNIRNNNGMNMNVRNSRMRSESNMGMQNHDCKETKKKLKMIDFALIDTALFLNAYPDNVQALEYYHTLKHERERLAASVNEKCGPLTAMNNESRSEWDWVSGPWPWEPDAN